VLENSIFGVYIEQEPYVRELIEAYMGSNFKSVLELLSQYSVCMLPLIFQSHDVTDMRNNMIREQTRHYVDIHLFSHILDLMNLIRNWAVVLYFWPFLSIKLERMSVAFGWTVEEVEENVIALIQSGDIHGRVDSRNRVRSIS